MAKKNVPQTFVNPETGETITVKPKKKHPVNIVIIIVAIIAIIVLVPKGGSKSSTDGGAKTTETGANGEKSGADGSAGEAAPDLSNVATEYTLTAGYYFAGIDIPAGKFDLVAVSGDGNVSSSNIYSGGVNGMFGGPEADHSLYKETYNGIKLPTGESLEVTGDLTVKITYSRVDSDFTGRTEDSANTITLTAGNYDIGEDVPAGMYTIRVTEGSGNLSCSVYKGGLNELMGAPGTDNSIVVYIPEFKNATLLSGDQLTIGNMTVELVPMIPGYGG